MTPRQPSALLLAHVAATMRRHGGETFRDGRDHVHEPDRAMRAPVWYARCRVCSCVLRSPF